MMPRIVLAVAVMALAAVAALDAFQSGPTEAERVPRTSPAVRDPDLRGVGVMHASVVLMQWLDHGTSRTTEPQPQPNE